MTGAGFYDAGPVKQIAVNLFYGWGYNFYRKENQLRTDDLLVRGKVSWLLGLARGTVETAESDYRREFIPAPSRANPTPPPEAVKNAQALERLSRDIGSLEAQIRSQPAPENDFILRRFRDEGPTLEALLESDHQLVGQSEMLRSMLDKRDGAWITANLPALREGIQVIAASLQARQGILLIK